MSDSLRITFVLPFGGTHPCGGPKVVYEYANHLTRRGHSVTVVHSALPRTDMPWINWVKSGIRYVQRRMDGSYRPDRWFEIDPKVRLTWVPCLFEQFIPDAEVIVATSWETAEFVNGYSKAKGRPFYLVQGLETWNGNEERVYATWKMPLKKIVISQWLRKIANGLGQESIFIPNGLNFRQFGLDVPPVARNKSQCMMLYQPQESKGCADGLEALSIVKQQIPGLRAILFGVQSPPSRLPNWIAYHREPHQAALRNLYNESSIFMAPSWTEGWGLPASEAMMCGAAVVATDIGGHREFALHEQTALVSPVKNPRLLAANVLRLISDPEFRVALAMRGNAYIQQFSWERSVEQFEAALMQEG